jgi:hypothetical protein
LRYCVALDKPRVILGGYQIQKKKINVPYLRTSERDPREVVDTRIYNGWVMDRVLPYLEEYACSVEKYPNLPNNDSSHKSCKSYIGGLIDKIDRMRVGE